MIFVDQGKINDPSINLAIEEYLLRNIEPGEDILLFYINGPSIIIGRHQNTIEEINQPYVEAHNIRVVRRLSGGGAVYHDLGNLNFSFITQNARENVHNFRKFTEPVIKVLQEMGVPAELSGRNDILADGRKISGNAQYITTRRMFNHGTLLFNSDLSHVQEALNVKQSKIVSKGIKSVRSRVANISEFLKTPMTVEEFKQRVLTGVFAGASAQGVPQYLLTAEDWQGINKLTEERYRSWDWNYGESPAFNVQKINRFPFGEIDARIDVQRGVIRSIKFFGDFFSQAEPAELEQRLVGARYAQADLQRVMEGVNLGDYFQDLSQEEFLSFLV
jgi:lipoate---protein ligase